MFKLLKEDLPIYTITGKRIIDLAVSKKAKRGIEVKRLNQSIIQGIAKISLSNEWYDEKTSEDLIAMPNYLKMSFELPSDMKEAEKKIEEFMNYYFKMEDVLQFEKKIKLETKYRDKVVKNLAPSDSSSNIKSTKQGLPIPPISLEKLKAAEKEFSETKIISQNNRINEMKMRLVTCINAENENMQFAFLLLGERGTGKDLFANAIHQASGGTKDNFVSQDCSAIPEGLLENLFFGQEKGSHSAANEYKPGLIERAKGGTLFLDEVGNLPLEQQNKFLRVLETRKVLPLGATKPISVKFRLVCATNKDLDRMLKENTFQGDLFESYQ